MACGNFACGISQIDFGHRSKSAFLSIDENLNAGNMTNENVAYAKFARASFKNFQGDPSQAYEDLATARDRSLNVSDICSKDAIHDHLFSGNFGLAFGE